MLASLRSFPALGIAVLGSIGTAVYRQRLAETIPAAVPAGAAHAGRDTLGGATAAVADLPPWLASPVLKITRDAFTDGFHIAAIAAGGIVAILAVVTVAVLRRTQSDSAAADTGSG
jgi:DHA2 family multidrug resistance protein-like MFS transporter